MYTFENITKRIKSEWMPFFNDNKEHLDNILIELNNCDKIYPNKKDIFRALYYHNPKDITLLILGQDPYISEENNIPQAMGLSFSVPKSHKIPPSLVNIFKEIKSCYPNYIIPKHGFLKRWALTENILLLNSALTVLPKKSNSHSSLWQDFTDKLIKWFQDNNDNCIFLLMGNFAKNKSKLIDSNKHKIFTTIHPSPLSAYNGFFGCNIFKEINVYLLSINKKEINW
jgi:uracil-DNA glycosylase